MILSVSYLKRTVGVLILVFLGLVMVVAPAPAFDASQNPGAGIGDDEIESRFVTRVQEKAAEYRLARTQALVSEADEKAAADYAQQARLMLETGEPQPLESAWHWFPPQWWFVNP
jgi:hypothetical protein